MYIPEFYRSTMQAEIVSLTENYGMEFTPEQNTAFQKAALLCSKSEKCSADLQEKLKLWGLTENSAEPVLKKLIDEKYIDDERFARAYVKDKFRFNHWGKQKIAYMLRAKSIADELIKLAFEEIEGSGYSENLKKLLEDKSRSVKAQNAFDKRNKLMRFALSRGFESGEIYKVLREMGI